MDGSTVTITASGTYVLSGELTDGSIVINSADKNTVRLIFNGVTISSLEAAPVLVTDVFRSVVLKG